MAGDGGGGQTEGMAVVVLGVTGEGRDPVTEGGSMGALEGDPLRAGGALMVGGLGCRGEYRSWDKQC